MQTVWRDDQRYVNAYWSNFSTEQVYSTFDWGIRDQDGYYFILGRTDDVINVAGHRLGTREIEESISSHDNVSEVAVVGEPHAEWGEAVVAFVVMKVDAQPDPALLDAWCLSRMARFKRPKRYEFVAALPKNNYGKVLKRDLREALKRR